MKVVGSVEVGGGKLCICFIYSSFNPLYVNIIIFQFYQLEHKFVLRHSSTLDEQFLRS